MLFGAFEDRFDDPQLTLQSIARLWESRNYSEIISRMKDLDPAAGNTSPNLIAYKALALYETNQTKDADALVAQLESRGTDDHG